MIRRRHVKYSDAKLIKKHKISDELNSISPLKRRPQHQKDFMDVNYAHIAERKNMMDDGDVSNLKVAAKAKIDNLGYVRSHSRFVNYPSRLERMKQKSELSLSLVLGRKRQNYASEDKVVNNRASLVPLLIDAVNMFKKGETTKQAFTKDHIKSIIILVFRTTVDKFSKKGEFLDKFNGLNQKDTKTKMYFAVAEPPPLSMMPSLPPIERTDEAPEDSSVVASGNNTNVDKIYKDPEE